MADKPTDDTSEPTQRTDKGHEIPLPLRRDVFAGFRRITRRKAGSDDDGGAEQE